MSELTTREVADRLGVTGLGPVHHLMAIGALHNINPAKPGKRVYPRFDSQQVKRVKKLFKPRAQAAHYAKLLKHAPAAPRKAPASRPRAAAPSASPKPRTAAPAGLGARLARVEGLLQKALGDLERLIGLLS